MSNIRSYWNLILEERLQWLGWGLIFSCFYILPRNFQNASFFIGLAIVLLEARHIVWKFVVHQKLFALVCGVFVAVTCAQKFAMAISLSAAAETIGAITTVYLFVLAVSVCRLDIRQFLIMIAGFAVIGAAIGWILAFGYQWEGGHFRLSILGKGRNPIQAGALMAVGIFALISIELTSQRLSILRVSAVIFLTITLLATFSRGPILSFLLAIFFYVILRKLHTKNADKALVFTAFLSWLIVVAIVMWGDALKGVVCALSESLCRAGERQDIWVWVWQKILEHPFIGNGANFRFPIEGKTHAHNGVFGLTLAFGIPAALVFASWVIFILGYSKLNIRLDNTTSQRFYQLTVLLGFASMGSDLVSPFAFIGFHYLCFWLPRSIRSR